MTSLAIYHEKATTFLEEAYRELGAELRLASRLEQVADEIGSTGLWTPSLDELTIGAKIAWRNSNRCIGRLFWKSLKVIDARAATSNEDVFAALQQHLDFGFNGGEIRSVITLFRPRHPAEPLGPRVLNHQLLRFAGYAASEQESARPTEVFAGDPAEAAFTHHCQKLGWRGENGNFDFLPWVIRWPGRPDAWQMPKLDPRMIVNIVHPEFDWFTRLGLRWYAIPIISDMLLEIGGLEFTAAPFNGWYMGTEVGNRNFGDRNRYNLLPVIAKWMGLDCSSRHGLWQDRAVVELNRAVLYSFEQAGVTMVDHHTAAEQFVNFEQIERRNEREPTADWAWITPPLSASVTPVFHRLYDNTVRTPNFFYQDSPLGEAPRQPAPEGCPFHAKNKGL